MFHAGEECPRQLDLIQIVCARACVLARVCEHVGDISVFSQDGWAYESLHSASLL